MEDALSKARPLAQIPADVCRAIEVFATDIDDTITSDGRVPAIAFDALWRAHEAGLRVVPVTGRPAGWADHLARMWPVDAVVAENGALAMRHLEGRLVRRDVLGPDARAENRRRIDAVAAEILASVPGTALASDQPFRAYDVAIDWAEDVPRLPPDAVDRIVAIFRAHGASAKVSSIHVNGWFGEWDKLGMLRTVLREDLGIDVDARRALVLYAGDSPNDEPLFEHFPVTVGVANVADFRDRLQHAPAYLAERRGGEGFAEIVRTVIDKRSA